MAFIALAKTNELVEGLVRSVKIPGGAALLIVHQERLHIIEDRCPHMDVALATGTLESNEQAGLIRCRAHGIAFNLQTDEPEGQWRGILPCLKRYEPVYRDYLVGIDLAEQGPES